MNRVINTRPLLNYLITPWLKGHVCSMGTNPGASSKEQSSHHEDVNQDPASTQTEEESYAGGAEEGEDQLRKEILDAALPFVHAYGWSQDSLAQGAESLGYSGMAHGMFPKGGVELVNHFYASCNTKLNVILEEKVNLIKENPELKKGTTAFISDAVEERLRMNIEYLDSWHKALALHASPLNLQVALQNIGTLVDDIWYCAGDRSTDFNWYTKRGILAAVYKSSEIHMLQDKSEDFQDTWEFLNRRLSDVHSLGKCVRSTENFTKSFMDVSKAGLFTALNIFGLNNRHR